MTRTRLKILSLLVFLSFAIRVDAHPLNPWSLSDKPKASALHARVPAGSECEKILMSAAAGLGRPLTEDEIDGQLEKIIALTGEHLLDVAVPATATTSVSASGSAAPLTPSNLYFAGMAQVTTESGPTRIETLKKGDRVVSLDLSTGYTILSKIKAVRSVHNQSFGQLSSGSRWLVLGGSGSLLSDGGPVYAELAEINQLSPLRSLAQARLINAASEFQLFYVAQGKYRSAYSQGMGYSLELEDDVPNFIVNGFIVQNTKKATP